ncbi:MAG: protein kinase [Nanobdellota archaeon]
MTGDFSLTVDAIAAYISRNDLELPIAGNGILIGSNTSSGVPMKKEFDNVELVVGTDASYRILIGNDNFARRFQPLVKTDIELKRNRYTLHPGASHIDWLISGTPEQLSLDGLGSVTLFAFNYRGLPSHMVALDDWFKKLPSSDFIDYLVSAAQGVSYLHSQGIIHKHLSPKSILFDKDHRASITNIGLESVIEHVDGVGKNRKGAVRDFSWYLSSQEESMNSIDEKSNQYSLATSFGEVAALYYDIPTEHFFMKKRAPTGLFSRFNISGLYLKNPSLAKILNRATRKEPDERYDSVDEMVADLQTLRDVSGSTVLGTHYGFLSERFTTTLKQNKLWQNTKKWVRRNRLALTLASIPLVLGLGVFGYQEYHEYRSLAYTKAQFQELEAKEDYSSDAIEDALDRGLSRALRGIYRLEENPLAAEVPATRNNSGGKNSVITGSPMASHYFDLVYVSFESAELLDSPLRDHYKNRLEHYADRVSVNQYDTFSWRYSRFNFLIDMLNHPSFTNKQDSLRKKIASVNKCLFSNHSLLEYNDSLSIPALIKPGSDPRVLLSEYLDVYSFVGKEISELDMNQSDFIMDFKDDLEHLASYFKASDKDYASVLIASKDSIFPMNHSFAKSYSVSRFVYLLSKYGDSDNTSLKKVVMEGVFSLASSYSDKGYFSFSKEFSDVENVSSELFFANALHYALDNGFVSEDKMSELDSLKNRIFTDIASDNLNPSVDNLLYTPRLFIVDDAHVRMYKDTDELFKDHPGGSCLGDRLFLEFVKNNYKK